VRKLTTGTLDPEKIVKAVQAATEEVFTTMLGMEVRAGDPYVETNAPGPTDGVVSLVGLAGSWSGSGSIHCSASFACKLCSQFLMTDFQSVDEEVLDAVAELANMIIGNFKNIAEADLGPLMLSIPTVVFGRNFTTRNLGKHEWTVIPFQCGDERFDVQICLIPTREPTHAVRSGIGNLHPAHC
jgi:chemotaxis protein CheX